ncbi:MAG: hypothetical protein GF375_07580 [Candidatus Omnitrophica bacterium]|nr:hypothetical protein [Candidatus Omnitrophota bacterium]MBD3269831.1 hypothetical protein [Candidatus Omnitrophota bacterium]
MDKKRGHYLGTEINKKWYKRYTGSGLFARGRGQYWYDDNSFYFLRQLTESPIVIPLESIKQFETGKWHCGRWCFGYDILKIIWAKDGLILSSGFFIAKDRAENSKIISELKKV